MSRKRYNKAEALNRILLTLQGKTLSEDSSLSPEVLSENQALSDIAEILAGSLPDEVYNPPPALKYGHMFQHNGTGTVAVASQDVFYEVSGSAMKSGLVNGFTFANGMHLRANSAGRYFISYSISAEGVTNDQEIEAVLMVNGIAQTGSSAHSQTSGVRPASNSGVIITDLAANARVGVGLANHSGTNAMRVEHLNVAIFSVAPYGG